jgi:hypothetical protein
MLFMVIEQFRNKKLLHDRFQSQGQLLPENVVYQASWIDPATHRCYQVMEASDREALMPWIESWNDIVDFEVIPVLTSQEFWARDESGDVRAAGH